MRRGGLWAKHMGLERGAILHRQSSGAVEREREGRQFLELTPSPELGSCRAGAGGAGSFGAHSPATVGAGLPLLELDHLPLVMWSFPSITSLSHEF